MCTISRFRTEGKDSWVFVGGLGKFGYDFIGSCLEVCFIKEEKGKRRLVANALQRWSLKNEEILSSSSLRSLVN